MKECLTEYKPPTSLTLTRMGTTVPSASILMIILTSHKVSTSRQHSLRSHSKYLVLRTPITRWTMPKTSSTTSCRVGTLGLCFLRADCTSELTGTLTICLRESRILVVLIPWLSCMASSMRSKLSKTMKRN